MDNGLRRCNLGLPSPQVFGVVAMGQENVQVAGKPVDFPRCELISAVVEEVGKAPHTHSVLEVNKRESRALMLAAHPSSIKARHRSRFSPTSSTRTFMASPLMAAKSMDLLSMLSESSR